MQFKIFCQIGMVFKKKKKTCDTLQSCYFLWQLLKCHSVKFYSVPFLFTDLFFCCCCFDLKNGDVDVLSTYPEVSQCISFQNVRTGFEEDFFSSLSSFSSSSSAVDVTISSMYLILVCQNLSGFFSPFRRLLRC